MLSGSATLHPACPLSLRPFLVSGRSTTFVIFVSLARAPSFPCTSYRPADTSCPPQVCVVLLPSIPASVYLERPSHLFHKEVILLHFLKAQSSTLNPVVSCVSFDPDPFVAFYPPFLFKNHSIDPRFFLSFRVTLDTFLSSSKTNASPKSPRESIQTLFPGESYSNALTSFPVASLESSSLPFFGRQVPMSPLDI